MEYMKKGFEPFEFPRDEEITGEVIQEYIDKHGAALQRLKVLNDMYKGNATIFERDNKALHKPDNRIDINFPKYITDTFCGFFNGIPVKKKHEDETFSEAIKKFDNMQDMQDEDAELAKLVSIFGYAFELLYQDENAKTNVVSVSPLDMFIVYDESVASKPLFAVRYGLNSRTEAIEGTLYTEDAVTQFKADGGNLVVKESEPNIYEGLPVIEYIFNKERIGIFESVKSMIDAYDKALSEKTNDVDYFSDSYLKILGADIDEETLVAIRDNRIINLPNAQTGVVVEFLDKPDSDAQTENLLDRLKEHIFQIAMTANISDENFGSSSGVALAYKLQPMDNLAAAFERKFQAGMNKRYKLFASLLTNVPEKLSDAWGDIEYKFTRNMPKNILEEAQTAVQLATIASRETTLSVLSVVPDVRAEIDRMDSEREDSINLLDYQQEVPEKETFEVVEKEDS
ncbi:portal protein [Brochothrix phage BtpYZU01]|nr:portal protein [Brochothrix phage BtpYZU01]